MALADAAPALNLLVGARSKEVLARVLQDAYDGRVQGFTRDRRRRLCEELTLPDDAAASAARPAPLANACACAVAPLR